MLQDTPKICFRVFFQNPGPWQKLVIFAFKINENSLVNNILETVATEAQTLYITQCFTISNKTKN